MVREIKFRYWCKDGQMSKNFFLQETTGVENWDNLIPMQYTGLKDKEGKEIYEGDIMFVPMDYGPAGFIDEVVQVPNIEPPFTRFNYGLWDKGNVIGNIYENPELLEEIEWKMVDI